METDTESMSLAHECRRVTVRFNALTFRVTRYIAGANIFMVKDDKLKLGDFGCSAKLKDHTTMPGEMTHFVGTAAFMAPEVITQKGEVSAVTAGTAGFCPVTVCAARSQCTLPCAAGLDTGQYGISWD